ARAALVAQLEAAVAAEPGTAEPEMEDRADDTLARRIANTTAQFAEETFGTVSAVWRDLRGIRSLFADLPEERLQRISDGWLPLVLTIVSTLAVVWILTRIVARWRDGGHRPMDSRGLRERILAVVINAVTDIVVLAVAYATAALLSFVVFGAGGNISIEQSLYLNAFLVAGVVRIILRAFVLPDRPHQAISNFSQPVQRIIYRRAEAVTFLTVYGITAAVPIANTWVSFAAGRSIRIIVVTLAAIIALLAIRKVAKMVGAETTSQAASVPARSPAGPDETDAEDVVDAISEASIQAAASAWNRVWPWLAAAYVVSVYLISITRPRMMAEVIGAATLKTLGVIAIISIATSILRQSKTAQTRVPSALVDALPNLQPRLQELTSPFLRFIGAVLLIAAIGLFFDAWNIVDVGGWIASDAGSAVLSRIVSALLILGMVLLVWVLVSSWIDLRLSQELDGVNATARSRTLLALFRNAFTIAIFIFGTMIALSQLGIDIAPLLAGAGVIGLAIGFGSQKLVQDIITGVFIQLENAINEGDVVTVGGISGGVEKLTIRSVGLRSLDGVYHIVPFSSVDTVSNFMRKFSFHVEVVGIAYKESIPAAKDAMFEAFARLRAKEEHGSVILEDLEMHGVVALADSSVNLRARIKTLPGKQWAVGRAYTELLKEVFDERGIEIPFPHRQMIVSNPDASE
ncbi:MAG: mechanosensitive ion channel domain-containing protein, partial [Pseudomonadota bacterium]